MPNAKQLALIFAMTAVSTCASICIIGTAERVGRFFRDRKEAKQAANEAVVD